MESGSKVFDNIKFEKKMAIARFNRLRTLVRLRQLIEVTAVFAAISWCSARAPAVFRSTGASLYEFSTCLSNHHVVFLIGNAIIVLLLMLCRHSDVATTGGRREFYDDYVKYSEAARAMPTPQQGEEVAPAAEIGDCDKQIVEARAEETTEISQCDDAAATIEKAARKIRRFQRTQSEVLRREISVRQERKLQRSETESGRKTTSADAAEIDNLSNEEFRRRVDAFIDKHWSRKEAKFEREENINREYDIY